MSEWWNQRSLFTRLLVYAVAAILAFVMAASVGALATLVVSGNLSWPPGDSPKPEEPDPAGEQGKLPQRQQANTDRPQHDHQRTHADRSQQEKADAKREQGVSQDKQIPYVDAVGEIQANSVEAFLDSHEKLLRYDSLTSDDIEKMQANQAALQEFTDRAGDLSAPQTFRDHKDAFLSAIDELNQATQLAYALAADPISATQADFEDYDSHVNEAADDLQRANERLGKNYKTIEGVREVSTS